MHTDPALRAPCQSSKSHRSVPQHLDTEDHFKAFVCRGFPLPTIKQIQCTFRCYPEPHSFFHSGQMPTLFFPAASHQPSHQQHKGESQAWTSQCLPQALLLQVLKWLHKPVSPSSTHNSLLFILPYRCSHPPHPSSDRKAHVELLDSGLHPGNGGNCCSQLPAAPRTAVLCGDLQTGLAGSTQLLMPAAVLRMPVALGRSHQSSPGLHYLPPMKFPWGAT